ncbi:type IV secretory system conjugative DNA transfer family protein [Metabacillus fastidiosus]|uniref:type IV secretory system conjugative DNA transfer family protein n=1 Tax=Metabacillus fastidiosus TaxID=1458 RepID=UPI0008256251|nr:TraM recognition domain-containing protein [Metabacillus fastidiosus]
MQISKLKDFWFNYGDQIEEWIRMKFHTFFVSALTFMNLVIGVSALLTWLKIGFGFPFSLIPLEEVSWVSFHILLNMPLITWFYSTITQPVKKGYKVVVDWRATEKGRVLAFILNIGPLILILWIAAARYINEHYVPTLESISLSKEGYPNLLVHDFHSFITLLYIIPLILTLILFAMGYRHYKINENVLKKQFFKWEFHLFSRFAHNLLYNKFDVIVGWEKVTKKAIVLKESARFLHELVTGATGTGKTSTTILLRIAQDLSKIAKGVPGGVVLLEPKGDAVDDVLKLAKKLGVPDEKILVIDPTKEQSTKFNPFTGPFEAAAESFRGTLNSLTGDQDAFFKGQQEETASLYTMLAKLAFPERANITTLQRMYQDPRYLANVTESVRSNLDSRKSNPDNTESDIRVLERYERVVRYFEDEVLDYKTFREKEDIKPVLYPDGHRYAGQQVVESKKDKYVSGAKKYLNDIAMNTLLADLMVAKDGEAVLDLDAFLRDGGVLLVNTALGELEELSLLFGQFFIRQFQSAVFRRPKDGEEIIVNEKTQVYKRIPIYFTIDEFPLYINEAFQRFLTLGRSYRVGVLIAIQSLGQLDSVIKGYRETILSNASTKTVFGRGTVEDNKVFSETFLEEEVFEESLNESSTPVTVENPSWGLRHNTQKMLKPRFSPTDIAELPFKHMIVQMVNENESLDDAVLATGAFVSEAKFLKKYFRRVEGELELASENEEELLDIDKAIENPKFAMELKNKEVTSVTEPTSEKASITDQVESSEESTDMEVDAGEQNINQQSHEGKVEGTILDVLKSPLPKADEHLMWEDLDISSDDSQEKQIKIKFDDIPVENVNPTKQPISAPKRKKEQPEEETFEQLNVESFIFDTESSNSSDKIADPNEKDNQHSIPDSDTLESINELINLTNNQSATADKTEQPAVSLPNGVLVIQEEVEDDL